MDMADGGVTSSTLERIGCERGIGSDSLKDIVSASAFHVDSTYNIEIDLYQA